MRRLSIVLLILLGAWAWAEKGSGTSNTFSLDVRKKPKLPPGLSLTLGFDDSDGNSNSALDAGETGQLVIEVQNTGPGEATNLSVKVVPLATISGLNLEQTHTIALIPVNSSRKLLVPIAATEGVESGTVRFRVEVAEPNFGADADPKIISFEVRRLEPPDLVICDKGVQERIIEPGKVAHISMIIRNQGTGPAEQVTASVAVPELVTYLDDNPARFELGRLVPNDWRCDTFAVVVSKKCVADSIPFTVNISERRARFSKRVVMYLPLNRATKSGDEIVIPPKPDSSGPPPPPPPLTDTVDVDIPVTGIRNPDAIAVLIANRDYTNKDIPAVEYADRDVAVLREYLIKVLGYDPENVFVLNDALYTDFAKWFGTKDVPRGRLARLVKPGVSDVFVYYTGHGAPEIANGKPHFVTRDCDPNNVATTGYPQAVLHDNLNALPARSRTLVIDACFSGQSDKGPIITKTSPTIPARLPDKAFKGQLFASCDSNEIASWAPERQHSLFTYWFLKTLREAALSRQNLTWGELSARVAEQVSRRALRDRDREQHPQFAGDGSKVLLQR